MIGYEARRNEFSAENRWRIRSGWVGSHEGNQDIVYKSTSATAAISVETFCEVGSNSGSESS